MEAQEQALGAGAAYQEKVKALTEDEQAHIRGISDMAEAKITREQQAIDKLSEDIKKGKPDVKKIWSDHTGFAVLIGGFLKGLAAGILRQPDTFMAELRQRVQMDVEAEEAALSRMQAEKGMRVNMLGTMRKVFWDDPMKARQATFALKLEAAKAELQKNMGLAKTAEQQAAMMDAQAAIHADQQKHYGEMVKLSKGQVAQRTNLGYRGGSAGVSMSPEQQWWAGLSPASQAKWKKYYETEGQRAAEGKGVPGRPDFEGMQEATKRLTQAELLPYKQALNELDRRVEEAKAAGVDPFGWLTSTMRLTELDFPIVGPAKPFRGAQELISSAETNRVYQALERVIATAIKRGGGKALTPSEQVLFRAFTQGTGTRAAIEHGVEMAHNEVDMLMAGQLAPWATTSEGRAGVIKPLTEAIPGLYGGVPRFFGADK
jgi:hypothetical protein